MPLTVPLFIGLFILIVFGPLLLLAAAWAAVDIWLGIPLTVSPPFPLNWLLVALAAGAVWLGYSAWERLDI